MSMEHYGKFCEIAVACCVIGRKEKLFGGLLQVGSKKMFIIINDSRLMMRKKKKKAFYQLFSLFICVSIIRG